jgi:UDPglucose 6-dehydrogenase
MSSQGDAGRAPAVAVLGLWHLGLVTAACLAQTGLSVVALDPDPSILDGLAEDRLPVSEPGLLELVREGRASGRLTFAVPSADSLGAAELVWIAFDTPVDDEDRADVGFVLERASQALAFARTDALVVVSAQLPVGSVAELQSRMEAAGRPDLRFACVPENLRLGKAIETFRDPDRFVAGVRTAADREQLSAILSRFGGHVEWMGVESAEMTKHALNAFLATSVAFINEVAVICERVGADAAEVARGLKSEQRIGPRAYLSPGDAFAGGTLARDIGFLRELAAAHRVPAEVAGGVATSNAEHRQWARRTLVRVFSDGGSDDQRALSGRRIAIWGLTYKPGTDTLRRSAAVDLCRWLASVGATAVAYDPAVRALPVDAPTVELAPTALDACHQADALVVCTPWPEFREVEAERLLDALRTPLVLDAGGALSPALADEPSIRYLRVGAPAR